MVYIYILAFGALSLLASPPQVRDVSVEEVERQDKVAVARGGVTIPFLTVARDSSGRSAIRFDGPSGFSLGVDSLGNFSISSQDQPMLVIDNHQTVSIHMPKLSVRYVLA